MKRKSSIIILIVCIIVIIFGGILAIKHNTFSISQNQNSAPPLHVHPQNNYYTFPNNNPQFSVKINSKKTSPHSSYLRQQAISIYKIGHEEEKSIFQRTYNTDGFNGNELTYLFASNSASFTQQGELRTLNCTQFGCSLPWSNFYTWDANKNTFVLDNASHADEFTQLLTTYKATDTKGISSTDLAFFLKTEKVIQEIINGKNLSSNDIENTSL